MKIKIIENPDLEDEVIIECKKLTLEIEQLVSQFQPLEIRVQHRGTDLTIPIHDILFFETEGDNVYVHLTDISYKSKYRLYELETLLPDTFTRISKSTIVNIKKISAMDHRLTSARCIQFMNSHKLVYVSRMYYSDVKNKLERRSLL
ncbi:MAG: LytTR family DNA-binding domain-containing protein [Erysipelothrix sp.]